LRNFLAIAALDTLDVIAGLRQRQPATWTGVPEIVLAPSLLLRANPDLNRWREDRPIEDLPALTEWPAMVALLVQAKQAIMDGNELGMGSLTGQMARAMISRLDPGIHSVACGRWALSPAQRPLRARTLHQSASHAVCPGGAHPRHPRGAVLC